MSNDWKHSDLVSSDGCLHNCTLTMVFSDTGHREMWMQKVGMLPVPTTPDAHQENSDAYAQASDYHQVQRANNITLLAGNVSMEDIPGKGL